MWLHCRPIRLYAGSWRSHQRASSLSRALAAMWALHKDIGQKPGSSENMEGSTKVTTIKGSLYHS